MNEPKLILVAPPFIEGAIEKYLFDHLVDCAKSLNIEYHAITPAVVPRIGNGFYNNESWMLHCATSIQRVMRCLSHTTGPIRIMFSDFWFPGIDIVALHRHLTGADIKIGAWVHGASFVEGDLIKNWVPPHVSIASESAWLESLSTLWAGSEFFVENLPTRYRPKVRITGQPFDPAIYSGTLEKKWDVVLPCRFADDKINVADLIELATKLPHVSFVITAQSPGLDLPPNISFEWRASEEEHLDVLRQSRVVFSMATQEGWGYGILKAVALGCVPVLPNRAVYPDLYASRHLYESMDEAAQMIQHRLEYGDVPVQLPTWTMRAPLREFMQ